MSSKLCLGRNDKIDLPQMKLTDIAAKVDTGAYTSALHCHHISTVKKEGKELLIFKLLDPAHNEYNGKEYVFENYRQKKIKNSFGHVEWRYIITTKATLFDTSFDIEFSLTDRESMKFPILLGRKFLRGRFIIDVTQKNLSHKKKKRK